MGIRRVNAEASYDKIRADGDRLRSSEGGGVVGNTQCQYPITFDGGQYAIDFVVSVFVEMSVGVDQHRLMILIASDQVRAGSPEERQGALRSR
jgi:hypothetical protein